MNKAKILIIEDNEDLAFSLSKVLKKEGFTIFMSTTGEEGIAVLQKELIDIVLLDLKLPKMNGIDTLIQMK